MRYAWLVIAILAARFLATAIDYPSGDGDLAWQRWLGKAILRAHAIPRTLGSEAFAAPGAPWLPQEWLFSLGANAGRSHIAWIIFAGSVALCAVIALALAAWHARRKGASRRAVALCTAFAGIALYQSFGVRAQIVAWPLIALYLLLLDSDGGWPYVSIAVAALWSNLHASAVLAPLFAALLALGATLEAGTFDRRARTAALVAAGSLAAICCNPFGWHLIAYAVALFDSPIRAYIVEWQVTNVDDTSFTFGALPLFLLALVACSRRSASGWRDRLLLAASTFLLLGAARNIALFAIVALPPVAAALTRSTAWFSLESVVPAERLRRNAAIALPAISLVLALVVGGLLVRRAPPPLEAAAAPIRVLAARRGPHRLFCADFAWCGLALRYPNVRVFLDGRADPYPVAVWNDFAKIIRVGRDWRATLDRRRVDAVVVARDAPLDQALALTPGWRARYSDRLYRLWLKS